MKLQVNINGAWRNVLPSFKAADQNQVRDAAQFLARAGGVRGMKIMDDGIEVAWCEAPHYEWRLPG